MCLFCACDPEFGCACLTCPIDSCNDLFCDPEVGECIYTPLDLCGDGFCDSFCGEDISNCCEDCVSCACGPGNGDCYQAGGNGTPGCEDVECCDIVCSIDPYCCDTDWDGLCADDAAELCVQTVTLSHQDSYDFSTRVFGEITGGDLYFLFPGSDPAFWANNVGQLGTQDLGDLGNLPLTDVIIPPDGYTLFEVPAFLQHTYVTLDGSGAGFIVFRVTAIDNGLLAVDLDFILR